MIMRRATRRLTWVCLALCVVVLGFGLTTRLLSLISGVTEDNVRRIHIGMSAKEVAAILGEPPQDGSPVELKAPPDEHTRQIVERWEKVLNELVETKPFQKQITLKEALCLLQDHFKAKYGPDDESLPISVDDAAFKADDTDNRSSIYETAIKFPPFPRQLSVTTALGIILAQIPTNNATFVVRPLFIEITTAEVQAKEHAIAVRGLVMPLSQTGRIVLPDDGSKWEAWTVSGKARVWTWSSEQLAVFVWFDENRQVCAIQRTAGPGPRQPTFFLPVQRRVRF
jgi:hypothetical protein